MRYFMFSYVYKNALGSGFGTYFKSSEKFPSLKSLAEEMQQPIIILSTFEFKNQEDFLNAQNID